LEDRGHASILATVPCGHNEKVPKWSLLRTAAALHWSQFWPAMELGELGDVAGRCSWTM
jgi:hypothetical protein